MHKFLYSFECLLVIVCLSILYACVPAVCLSPSPKTSIVSKLPESFLNPTNEKYIAVPIWTKNPFVYYDSHKQNRGTLIGDGFFLRKDEIADLNEQIPRKFEIGIGSIFGNIGRDVSLDGVLLISESLSLIYAPVRPIPGKIFDLDWGNVQEVLYIEDSHKKALRAMFVKDKVDKSYFKELWNYLVLFNSLEK